MKFQTLFLATLCTASFIIAGPKKNTKKSGNTPQYVSNPCTIKADIFRKNKELSLSEKHRKGLRRISKQKNNNNSLKKNGNEVSLTRKEKLPIRFDPDFNCYKCDQCNVDWVIASYVLKHLEKKHGIQADCTALQKLKDESTLTKYELQQVFLHMQQENNKKSWLAYLKKPLQ